jgi:hypothetical protein
VPKRNRRKGLMINKKIEKLNKLRGCRKKILYLSSELWILKLEIHSTSWEQIARDQDTLRIIKVAETNEKFVFYSELENLIRVAETIIEKAERLLEEDLIRSNQLLGIGVNIG